MFGRSLKGHGGNVGCALRYPTNAKARSIGPLHSSAFRETGIEVTARIGTTADRGEAFGIRIRRGSDYLGCCCSVFGLAASWARLAIHASYSGVPGRGGASSGSPPIQCGMPAHDDSDRAARQRKARRALSASVWRSRIPVCSMVDGSDSFDCRIFGRFRPVMIVRKCGAILDQSAIGARMQTALYVAIDAVHPYRRSGF